MYVSIASQKGGTNSVPEMPLPVLWFPLNSSGYTYLPSFVFHSYEGLHIFYVPGLMDGLDLAHCDQLTIRITVTWVSSGGECFEVLKKVIMNTGNDNVCCLSGSVREDYV